MAVQWGKVWSFQQTVQVTWRSTYLRWNWSLGCSSLVECMLRMGNAWVQDSTQKNKNKNKTKQYLDLCHILCTIYYFLIKSIFWASIFLYSSGWPGTCYEVQVGFELTILLSQPPNCWDYMCVPRHLTFIFYLSFWDGFSLCCPDWSQIPTSAWDYRHIPWHLISKDFLVTTLKDWKEGLGNTTLGDILKRLWHRLLQRHLHTHVYCGTIHNSQVMKTAKMPHHRRIN
jgi:hypothetical protein